MQLFGSLTSPFVRHCRIALAQEGLDFEYFSVNFEESAQQSPTKRVPFMKDGDMFLTDSSSILTSIRSHGDKVFLPEPREANRYFTANTALDTGINLFLLEKDGLTDSPYLERQKARMQTVFEALEEEMTAWKGVLDDGFLRIACLLTWVSYRNRFDFSGMNRLSTFDKEVSQLSVMQETMPPPL